MKSRDKLGWVLISIGLLILIFQGVRHWYVARHGALRPFDEDGERVAVPFIGTVCLGSGIFLLALSGGGRTRE